MLARVLPSGLIDMLGKLRGLVDKVALPLGKLLGGLGITPSAVTIFGFLVVTGGCYLVATGRTVGGAWVIGGGSLMDLVDGSIARAMKTQSRKGAFIDSTFDRLSDGVIFAALIWILAADPLGLALAVSGMLLGFLISYVRARAESLGFSGQVGIAERAERTVLVVAGLIFDILVPMLAVLVVISFVTVVHRFVHVYRQAGRVRD